jgi:hypothetical protein
MLAGTSGAPRAVFGGRGGGGTEERS